MKKILCVLFALLLSVGLVACGERNDPPIDDPNDNTKPTIPVEENFSFENALAQQEGWEGLTKQNPVFDTANRFVTFRAKSNNMISYKTKGMSTGEIKLKLKVGIANNTTATICFSNQAKDLSDFFYEAGGRNYSLEFASDSKVYLKKWIDEKETVLQGNKSQANVPFSLASQLTSVVIKVTEEDNKVSIRVTAGDTLLLDVADSDNPILGGGAVGLSYNGQGGMVVGGENSDFSKYTEPEELGLTLYDTPNVPVASETVNLLNNFKQTWVGRERIFNTTVNGDGSVLFESKDNPEEPLAGVTEFQALYKDKIFKNVNIVYEYNQVANGEWTMFWLRCVPEKSTDVSIWGNKKTGENTNGYSVLITNTGYVQFHKWSDFAQIWLNGQGTKVSGETLSALGNANATLRVELTIEEIEQGGNPAVFMQIKIGETIVSVTDTDTPYTSAGYIGLQGFATNNKTDAIKVNSATVTPIAEE